MRKRHIMNLKHLEPWRRELRRNMTPAEATLWKLLKGKQFEGGKFRRQTSIENYIADFYCAEAKLIIELDGEIHNSYAQTDYDANRDDRLSELGFKVIRFENKLVLNHPEYVLEEIRKHL